MNLILIWVRLIMPLFTSLFKKIHFRIYEFIL